MVENTGQTEKARTSKASEAISLTRCMASSELANAFSRGVVRRTPRYLHTRRRVRPQHSQNGQCGGSGAGDGRTESASRNARRNPPCRPCCTVCSTLAPATCPPNTEKAGKTGKTGHAGETTQPKQRRTSRVENS